MSDIERQLANFDRQLKDANFHVRGGVPPKKAQGAISAFAQGISPEDILVLVDGTVFGSAQEGVVITEKKVYAKNASGRAQSIPLAEVESVAFKPGMLGSTITLNGVMELSPPGPSRAAMQQFAVFIEALAQLSRATPVAPVPTPAPVTPAKPTAAPVKPEATPVATKTTPTGGNTISAALPTIAIEVVEAKVTRSDVDEGGGASVDVILRAKQIRGKNISHLHYALSLCSAQGHVIGSDTGTYEYEADDDNEDFEFNASLYQANTFGASLDDALTAATLYVSVIGYATQSIKFAPATLSLGPVNLKPMQPELHADQLKILRATAITRKYSDSDNDVLRDVTVQVMVQKLTGMPLTGAGITMSIPDVDCSDRYFSTDDRSIPHSAFVISGSNGLTKSELTSALGNAIEAELYYYVPVVRSLAKKIGIEIEEADEVEDDQEDSEDDILSDFDNNFDKSAEDTDSDDADDSESDDSTTEEKITQYRHILGVGFISSSHDDDRFDLGDSDNGLGEVYFSFESEGQCEVLNTGSSFSFSPEGFWNPSGQLFSKIRSSIREISPENAIPTAKDLVVCWKYFQHELDEELPEHIEIFEDDNCGTLIYDAESQGACIVVRYEFFGDEEGEPRESLIALIKKKDSIEDEDQDDEDETDGNDSDEVSDNIVVSFALRKGDGEWPQGEELSEQEQDDLALIATFYLNWEPDESEDLEGVEIEWCEIIYDGVTSADYPSNEFYFDGENVSGYPEPVIRFKLNRAVDPEAFLHHVWSSSMNLMPVARSEDDGEAMHCEDHNGYSRILSGNEVSKLQSELADEGLEFGKRFSAEALMNGVAATELRGSAA